MPLKTNPEYHQHLKSIGRDLRDRGDGEEGDAQKKEAVDVVLHV